MGKEGQGAILLNPQCRHGTHDIHWDTTDQRQKRNAVAENSFSKNRNELENGRVIVYTSFYTACSATIQFWADSKRSDLLLSDVHDKFIPRLYWYGAVTVHGGADYVRMAVAASLIAHAMLVQLESQGKRRSIVIIVGSQLATFDSLSASLSSLIHDDISHDFDKLLNHPALAASLEIMDHSSHGACDCLEYIVTAAKMGPPMSQCSHDKCSFVKYDDEWACNIYFGGGVRILNLS